MTTVSNNISQHPAQETRRDLVITCIEDHPKAFLLLLAAYKHAQEIKGRWRVVFIETPEHHTQQGENWNEHRLRLMTRAKQMGAETEHLEAVSTEQGMKQLLEKEAAHVSLVVIGKIESDHRLLRWKRAPWVSLVETVSPYARVELIALTGQFRQPLRDRIISSLKEVELIHIFYALGGVVVPSLLTLLLKWTLPPALFRINEDNVSILFIIACAFIAGRYGLIPGLITAVVGFLVENYYFTVPYLEFKFYGITDLFSMALFLFAALFIALYTSNMRNYVKKITQRELSTEMLFMLYRLTSESYTRQQAIDSLQANLQRMLEADVAFFMPTALNPKVLETASPNAPELTEKDQDALNMCWSDMKSTGVASPYNPGTAWRFEPMLSANGEVGVLGVRPRHSGQLDAWFGRMLGAIADQTAVILVHIELERSMEETRISEEREKLRVMLLSSVSHDLKTPLASIIGALSAYLTLGPRLKPEKHNELIEGSLQEARRLDSFITNILDMTRLETGNVKFKNEWYGIRQITDDVVKRLQHTLRDRQVHVHLPSQEIEASMDIVMTGQVLQNILDNACKYTPVDTRIDITWESKPEGLLCSVRDHGGGIPEDKLEHVFDKFARLHKKDSAPAGTGLGLAIARVVMQLQGGWIAASNHPEGGAMFTLCFPHWRYLELPERKEQAYASY
jgi:two-component system, OmpR family, sensor histidine kinase KdpD